MGGISANAIDAFDDMGQVIGQILIRTEVSSDRQFAIVHIQDNGLRMTEDVKKRAFDHLQQISAKSSTG